MTNDNGLSHAVRKRIAVVHNDDFGNEILMDSDEPPSLEANAEVAVTANQISNILNELGYESRLFKVSDSLDELLNELADFGTEAVFNLVESLDGDPGRESDLPNRLESLGIPYTGNSPMPLRLSHAKDWVRRILSAHNIPIAPGFIIQNLSDFQALVGQSLRYPLFVKPARTDASIGIDQNSIVHNKKDLQQRVGRLLNHGLAPVLVEQYLPGNEVNIAIFPNPFTGATAMTCIDFSAYPKDLAPIVTYNCKWVEDSPEYLAFSRPCVDSYTKRMQDEIFRIARAAFLVLGGNGYGRVDLRFNANNRPKVIDVNPNPDLAPDAGFTLAAHSTGVSYPDLIRMLVEDANIKEYHVSTPYSTTRSRSLSCSTAAY